MTIQIDVAGKPANLTIEQARDLWRTLNGLFGQHAQPAPAPYPTIFPQWPPAYPGVWYGAGTGDPPDLSPYVGDA